MYDLRLTNGLWMITASVSMRLDTHLLLVSYLYSFKVYAVTTVNTKLP